LPCCRPEFSPCLHLLRALPFLQNGKLPTNQPSTPTQTTPAIKVNTLALQVPTTTFPTTLPICRCPFLQKVKIFKKNMRSHALQVPITIFLMTSASKIMRILLLQIPATIILMTSSFMQNSPLFNLHRTLRHHSCQERKLRLPLAFLQNVQLQIDPSSTPMPSTSTAQTPKSTPGTMLS